MPGFIAIKVAALFILTASAGEAPPVCKGKPATELLIQGMQLQSELETEEAMASYEKCIQAEPECVPCRYEIGWSYWKLGRWEDVIKTWESVLKLDPDHVLVAQYLPTARENLSLLRQK